MWAFNEVLKQTQVPEGEIEAMKMLARFILWLSSDRELTRLEVAVILEQSLRAQRRLDRCRTLADKRVEVQVRFIRTRALDEARLVTVVSTRGAHAD